MRRVLIPANAPEIAEILRLVLGWAWTYVIVAELIGSSSGIGHMIIDSQALLATGQMIFGIIVIGIIGLISDFLFKAAEPQALPVAARMTRHEPSSTSVSRGLPGVRGGAPVRALEPTNLAVAQNDFITILGPSGCGKSTLLRIVAGLDRPSAGRVLLDGRAVNGPGADRGMVFQSYTLFPWLTSPRTSPSACARRACRPRSAADIVARPISRRSACAASRTIIPSSSPAACSSARRSPARSPTTPRSCCSTSPSARSTTRPAALMQELLLGIWERERKTVLFVTHDIEEAIFLASRVIVMSARPGRIKADVPVDLPHPRHYTMKTSPDFSALKAQLTEEIRVEAMLAEGVH